MFLYNDKEWKGLLKNDNFPCGYDEQIVDLLK